MKNIILIFILFANLACANEIFGQWQYYQYIYKGNVFKPHDPTLKVIYELNENGDSHLFWQNEDLSVFCERRGKYSFDSETIVDTVTWVNPNNTGTCSRDPDMKQGLSTRTKYFLNEGILTLELWVNEDPLHYMMKRL